MCECGACECVQGVLPPARGLSPAGIRAVELQGGGGHEGWPHLPCCAVDHVALAAPPVVHLWGRCGGENSEG